MVAYAEQYDGALAQITKVLSGVDGDTAERRLHHKNKGCCYATLISHLPKAKAKITVKKEKEGGDNNEDNKQGVGAKRSAEFITLE
jgi:hypothetical protein